MRKSDDKPAEPVRFYQVSEAADILRVSPMTLYRAIKAREFPAVIIRGRISVPARAIENMEKAALFRDEAIDAAEFS